jgi:hypothetical protein
MSKLPLLSKNASLSVYISQNFIYAHLAYSHYDIKRSYIFKDVSPFNRHFNDFSDTETLDFWLSYFKCLEEKWSWKILKDGVVKGVTNFENEGVGVNVCQISILKSHHSYKQVFDSLRKFSLDLKLSVVDKVTDQSLFQGISSYLQYEDILFLDLNSRFFKISRLEKEDENVKKNLSNIHLEKYQFNQTKVKWTTIDNLMNVLNSTKYKAFLCKYISSNFMANIWSNFLLNPILKSSSEALEDFVRAYITIQLLSMNNDNPRVCEDFGIKPKKNLLWISGDLLRIPEFKKILVSVIDGLELKGQFDLCFDIDSLIYTFGKSFSMGINSEDMIFEKKNFLPKLTKVFIPDIDLRADQRKVIFSGNLTTLEGKSTEIYAMSSEITEVNVKDPEQMFLEGRFIRKAYVEKYERNFTLSCIKDDLYWDRIIFDGRVKPVVYGPGAKANTIKFNMWLSNEPYT